jgi:hypothetical protein
MNYVVSYIIYRLFTTIEEIGLKFHLNEILIMRLCKFNYILISLKKHHTGCILNIINLKLHNGCLELII